MTDYTDALVGTTQAALDQCDPTFSSSRSGIYAFITIGQMHGVTVSFERRVGVSRQIARQVRDGVVLRFLIPRGARIDDLAAGLADDGELSVLIDAVLAGHLLTLGAEAAEGRLTDAAALARDDLFDALDSLARTREPSFRCAAIAGATAPPPVVLRGAGASG